MAAFCGKVGEHWPFHRKRNASRSCKCATH
jgi:hypothetical protein